MIGKANFSDEFKRDAVDQFTERGYRVAEVSERLGVSQHSLYAWMRQFAKRPEDGAKNPLSRRVKEGNRQTNLLRQAWEESGKVYGYRKLHDDLLDQGETCCPNQVARLASPASIKARIG